MQMNQVFVHKSQYNNKLGEQTEEIMVNLIIFKNITKTMTLCRAETYLSYAFLFEELGSTHFVVIFIFHNAHEFQHTSHV